MIRDDPSFPSAPQDRSTSSFRPALQHTLQLLQALTESATDALLVKDRDRRYLFCNRTGAALVGRPPSEIILQDDVALFGDETAYVIRAQDRRVMESGIAETDEQVRRTPQWLKVFETTKSPDRVKDIDGRLFNQVASLFVGKGIDEVLGEDAADRAHWLSSNLTDRSLPVVWSALLRKPLPQPGAPAPFSRPRGRIGMLVETSSGSWGFRVT